MSSFVSCVSSLSSRQHLGLYTCTVQPLSTASCQLWSKWCWYETGIGKKSREKSFWVCSVCCLRAPCTKDWTIEKRRRHALTFIYGTKCYHKTYEACSYNLWQWLYNLEKVGSRRFCDCARLSAPLRYGLRLGLLSPVVAFPPKPWYLEL